jgi:hypothetical protein
MNCNMKDMSYYIVEVSHRETNPIHRVICFHRSGGFVELFSAGYDGEERHNYKDLYSFEVVCELVEMNKYRR